VQVAGLGSITASSGYWRNIHEPGLWRRWGSGEPVEDKLWMPLVADAEAELAARKRVEDLERVRSLVADAAKGPSVKGEVERGYYLVETGNGMATVHAADGQQLHPSPLPKAVAERILAELRGDAEEDEDA
jgi:hypothetical protein